MNTSMELDRRCTATNRAGERCARAPILGGTVCSQHGGKSPTTIAAAKERLLLMVEPALDALYRILRHSPPCEHCGRSDDDKNAVVVRAAMAVLDRCGFGPSGRIELTTREPVAKIERVIIDVPYGSLARTSDGEGFEVPEEEPTGSSPAQDVTMIAETRENPKEKP